MMGVEIQVPSTFLQVEEGVRRGGKGVCPGTGKLAGADPTLNRWDPETFSHLPRSHSWTGWGLWAGHPGGSLGAMTLPCCAFEDFMFCLRWWGVVWGKLLI